MSIKNNFQSFIGIVTIIIGIINVLKIINKKTETKIISEKALNVINDKDKAIKLREAINQYHKSHKWNVTEIESYL
jgi:hypothetical protein